MATQVVMPKLSPTMEEGQLARWLKNEGDKVSVGEPLAEIDTDKATMEAQALTSGVVRKILAQAGETIPLGQVIAIIGEPDEDISELLARPAQAARRLKSGSKKKLKADKTARRPSWRKPYPVARARKRPSRASRLKMKQPRRRPMRRAKRNRRAAMVVTDNAPAAASSFRRSRRAWRPRPASTCRRSRAAAPAGASSSATSKPPSKPGRNHSQQRRLSRKLRLKRNRPQRVRRNLRRPCNNHRSQALLLIVTSL